MKKKILIALFFVLILSGCSPSEEIVKLSIGESSVSVEVVKTEEQRARGLMYREELGEDRGMLFVFQEEQKLSFWMKNTSLPLSIAYIDKGGVIKEIFDLKPYDLNPVRSSRSVLYALEVNQGWFKEQGVEVGDRLIIPKLP